MKWKDCHLGVLSDQINEHYKTQNPYIFIHVMNKYRKCFFLPILRCSRPFFAGTRQHYCYMLKANQDHFYKRKYTCMTCKNCRLFETDPFSGSVKCLREKAGGSWKKERFIRKKAAVSNDDSSSEEESSDEEDDSSS